MVPSPQQLSLQNHESDERRFTMFAKLFATLTISLFLVNSITHSHGNDVSMSPPNSYTFHVTQADLTSGQTEVEAFASAACIMYWNASNDAQKVLLIIAGDPVGEGEGDLSGSCEGTSLSDFVLKDVPRGTHVRIEPEDTQWVYIAVDPYGTSPLTGRTVSATIKFKLRYPWATANPTNPIIYKTRHFRTLSHSHKFFLVEAASGS